MLVSAQKTSAIQPSQRSDMDPSTAAASALYSGLMQNVQNTATLQASQAVQQAGNTVNDNVAAAFAKTRVLLQATPPTASTAQANSATQGSALDEFKDYMSKSPEQRMRDRILEEMGITEEDLKNLPPEKQQAVAQEIAQRVQDKLKLAQVEKDANGVEKQVADKFLAAL
jgi:predicted flavoprotein YhiN